MIRRIPIAVPGLGAILVGAAAWLVSAGGGGDGEQAREPQGPISAIERRDLSRTTSASGSLGYSGRKQVLCRVGGTVTWLPPAGSVIERGQTMIEIDELPVVLFYGRVPAYRDLGQGVSEGTDVRQLERNLAELGFDPSGAMTVDEEFTSATAEAVMRWQDSVGFEQTGSVDLGRVVFLPGARRVAGLDTELGAAVGGGESGDSEPGGGSQGSEASTPVMRTTSTARTVSVDLGVADQGVARREAKVSIRLPNGSTVEGRVTRVSKVATTSDGAEGEQGGATIAVSVALEESGAQIARYDEAPVSVAFSEVVRKQVLAVPVTAIIARPGGGYAVNAVIDGSVHSLAVETGAFAGGFVEVSGKEIKAGMQVEDAA